MPGRSACRCSACSRTGRSSPSSRGAGRHARRLRVGDPLLAETEVGPLIRPRRSSGPRLGRGSRGPGCAAALRRPALSATCYAPTVLLEPPPDCRVSTQEVFGPVVCVYGYDDLDEAIGRANALPWAFQAAVFTRDHATAMHAYAGSTPRPSCSTTTPRSASTGCRLRPAPIGPRRRRHPLYLPRHADREALGGADAMKTRAAVLSAMGTPGPYEDLETAGDRGTGARPAGAGRGAGPDQGRGPVPFRPVGDQRRPATAPADGARPRGGRHRRGGRAGCCRPRPRRSCGLRVRPLLRPLRPVRRRPASLVRAGCGRERAGTLLSARAGCTGPTGRRCSITWASRASPSTPRSRAIRW